MPEHYVLIFGDDERGELPDDLSMAIDWMVATIKDLKVEGILPAWRALALLEQAHAMPRAGLSFSAPGVGLIAAKRERCTT